MRILRYLSVVACGVAIPCVGECASPMQESMATIGYTSVGQALETFSTNTPAGRASAYKYVENAAINAKSPNALRIALGGLRTMAMSLDRISHYETFCIQNGETCTNESRQIEWFSAFARTPSLSKDPEPVAGQLEKILSQKRELSPKVRLELIKSLAEILAVNMSDLKKCMGLLEQAVEKADDDVEAKASVMAKQMDIYHQVGRDDECEAKAKSLVELPSCPDSAFAAASGELARFADRRGEGEKAGELLADAIERCAFVPVGYPLRLIKVKAGTNAVERAIFAMRRKIASAALRNERALHSAIERWQPELIALLSYCGRGEEALGECRVWMFFAPQSKYQSAVELTAKTMKETDGNLGRAVEFMNFQRKGVVPKGRNPMMDAARLGDPVRKSVLAGLEELQRDSWSDMLARSRWMLWLDDPYLSVEAALAAFSVAPFSDRALQSCANAVMSPILASTRDPAAARRIVNYLMHGEKGRDGKMNTADDIKNPLVEFGEALRTGEAR